MVWAETFKSGRMPDGSIQKFENQQMYIIAYYHALHEWLKYA